MTDIKISVTVLLEGTEDILDLQLAKEMTLSAMGQEIIEERNLNVNFRQVHFFSVDDRFTQIPGETTVDDFKKISNDMIVMRYPFSKSTVTVYLDVEDKIISLGCRHTGEVWHRMIKHVRSKFPYLIQEGQFKFLCTFGSDITFVDIEDEICLNTFIRNAGIQNNMIIVKAQLDLKSFSKWTLCDAVNKVFSMPNVTDLSQFEKFEIDDLQLSRLEELSSDDFSDFKKELGKRLKLFNIDENSNEATKRELISTYLVSALYHVHKKEERLSLTAEYPLNGRIGHGKIDYGIIFEKAVILITEAKKDNLVDGCGQNLIQLHVASQNLAPVNRKRKVNQRPPPVYGIVTDGFKWYFLEYVDFLSGPKLRISAQLKAKWKATADDKADKSLKLIIKWIINLVLKQIEAYGEEPEF